MLDLDVAKLIDEVKAGRRPLSAALAAIDDAAVRLAEQPFEAFSEPWLAWQTQAIRTCSAAIATLVEDPEATRVLDVGQVIVAVSALLSPGHETTSRLFVAWRLLDLDRAEWALDILGPDESGAVELVPEMQWKRPLIRAEALLRVKRAADAEPIVASVLSAEDVPRAVVAEAVLHRSRAHAQAGRTKEALDDAQDAVGRWAGLDDAERRSVQPGWRFYFHLGEVARSAGRFAEALSAFESGRAVSLAAGHKGMAAFLLSEIGFTWRRAGDEERGTRILRDAAGEADALGHKTWAARWAEKGWLKYPREDESVADKLARGVRLLRQGASHADEAAAAFRECLRQAREEQHPEIEHAARNGVALAYQLQGRLLQAQLAQREAIAAAETVGDLPTAVGYRINLGWILVRRGRRDEAEAEAEAAIRSGEDLVRATSSVEVRQTIGVRLSAAYELLAFCAAVEFVPPGGGPALPPRPERAFDIGQRTRAVNLTRWLALGELSEQCGDAELEHVLSELRSADVRLETAAAAAGVAEPLGPLARSQQDAQTRWTTALRTRSRQVPDGAMVRDLAELSRALPDRRFVDLLSCEDGIIVNGFGSGGWTSIAMVPSKRAARSDLLTEWQLTLVRLARAHADGRAADPITTRRLEALSRDLDDQIVTPIARCLERSAGASHAVIFPHRELFQVPFWRLATALPGLTLSVLPGPAAAAVLARRARTVEGPWVAFGDVTGRLPHAAAELDVAPFDDRSLPTSATVQAHAPHAALLHFAGHGIFDPDNPYRSGLVAGAAPNDGEDPLIAAAGEHRVLTTAWILGRLRLPRCHTAVLSACYTGLPRAHPASEFTSLPAALLVAGSRNVVASLWPANDAAALLLMQELYRALSRSAPPWRPSAALARARRRLMDVNRDEALQRLAPGTPLPPGDRPFAAAWAADVFQHYGVD